MPAGFFRTAPGASAKPLFVSDKKCLIYVEGTRDSIDLHFWGHLLTLIFNGENFKFECYGSKTNVLRIAEEPRFHNSPIILCVDADLDAHIVDKIVHPRVLRTDGYSVENEGLRSVSYTHLTLPTKRIV